MPFKVSATARTMTVRFAKPRLPTAMATLAPGLTETFNPSFPTPHFRGHIFYAWELVWEGLFDFDQFQARLIHDGSSSISSSDRSRIESKPIM